MASKWRDKWSYVLRGSADDNHELWAEGQIGFWIRNHARSGGAAVVDDFDSGSATWQVARGCHRGHSWHAGRSTGFLQIQQEEAEVILLALVADYDKPAWWRRALRWLANVGQ